MNTTLNGPRKINIDFENLVVLYKHYKDFLLPIVVILISILVIIYIVFPQIQQYFNSQDLVKAEQQKLEALNSNYNLLTSLDNATIASNLNTLSLALPVQKDFAGIIDAISYVSAKTGVAVGNFEFSLGDLSSSNFGGTAYPSTQINISLKGSTKTIADFADQIVKTMPIAEVTTINISGGTGSLTILFYYKPFPAQNISDQTQITPLSVSQLSLIKEVSSWNSVGQTNFPSFPTAPASPSAENSGSPF
jgi:Tfp pilus assembly protein PilO